MRTGTRNNHERTTEMLGEATNIYENIHDFIQSLRRIVECDDLPYVLADAGCASTAAQIGMRNRTRKRNGRELRDLMEGYASVKRARRKR